MSYQDRLEGGVTKMTQLALYIAPGEMDEWDKSDIEEMANRCGSQTTYDFLTAYQSRFGIDLSQQISWVLDMEE